MDAGLDVVVSDVRGSVQSSADVTRWSSDSSGRTVDVQWTDPVDKVKVFGVGMHKTSTTSLASALYLLGYSVGGYFDTGQFDTPEALLQTVLDEAAKRDAVQDVPWPQFYKELDEQFPGSKFVLTLRDPDRWLRSVVKHFGRKRIPTHEYIYGVRCAKGNERVLLDYYNRHNQEVQEHFADRPGDLLVMDISKGDGWEVLCPFIGEPIPDFGFPQQNAAATKDRRVHRVIGRRLARGVGPVNLGGVLAAGKVGALVGYETFHQLSRRCDSLLDVGPSDAAGDRSEQSTTILKSWLSCQLTWAVDLGLELDFDAMSQIIEAGELPTAWRSIRPFILRWAGSLDDEGFGAKGPDGEDATEAIRSYVRIARVHWSKLAEVHGFGDDALDSIVRDVGLSDQRVSTAA